MIIAVTFTSLCFLKGFHVSDDALIMNYYTSFIEFPQRLIIFLLAFAWIFGILFLVPNTKIHIVTKAGENSLAIYLLHRYFTLFFQETLAMFTTEKIILASFLLTLITVVLLSRNIVTKYLKLLVEKAYEYTTKFIFFHKTFR